MQHNSGARPRVGIVLEQTLGHVTHTKNLKTALTDTAAAEVEWCDISFDRTRKMDRLPLLSNWTIRAGSQARKAVADVEQAGAVDALFVHTQVPAVFMRSIMNRIPTVVSLDATPKQIDEAGVHYDHAQGPAAVERLKFEANRRCFERAASIVAWSRWAADGLINEYGVDPNKIDVFHPGVILDGWRRPAGTAPSGPDNVVRVLFVGGDLPRKGGDILIEAVRRLRADPEVVEAGVELELHVATGAQLPNEPGIFIHNGLTPNSPELIALYHECHIFALPTMGDCLPMVLGEAAICEMPLVSTDIGAISEIVLDGHTGHIIEPNVESVMAGLRRLVVDREYRHRIGHQAADHAEKVLDAKANAEQILDRLVEHAARSAGPKVTLCVSGELSPTLSADIEAGQRPTADYVAIAQRCRASIIDRPMVAESAGVVGRLLGRVHPDLAMAHHLFADRRGCDVVITDGEQVGYPLAIMLRLGGRRGMRHIMIGHRLSAPKKVALARVSGLQRGIDEVLLYSSRQMELAATQKTIPASKTKLIDFMVDTEFFDPADTNWRADLHRPLLVSAGREGRDYPTMIEAVRDLDVDVLIASASPWSRRDDNAHATDLPANVEVTRLTQGELRDALGRCSFAVVPVVETDFQAGITTILESMAMGRATVCTRTAGQTDVIVDQETGRYVEPGSVDDLRRVIKELLDDPVAADAMGHAAREVAKVRMDVRVYADGFAAAVNRHSSGIG